MFENKGVISIKQVIYLTKRKLKKEIFDRVIAFSASAPGAMGTSGIIEFVTEREVYCVDYVNGDVTFDDLCAIFSVLDKCQFGYFGEKSRVPNGWEYAYLGMGNHLVLRSDIAEDLFKKIDRNGYPEDIYVSWKRNVIEIMEGRRKNMEKVANKPRNLKLNLTNGEPQLVGGNSLRKSLEVEWEGYPGSSNLHKKVIAIGINPSTATTDQSDMTMTKLCRFLDLYGYDNVKMTNLYSDVTPKLTELKRVETNFEEERQNLEEADIILLVWGIDGYEKRKQEAFDVLLDYKEKIYCIKNPKGSYPVHPSRMPYDSEIIKVDSLAELKKCGMK